LEVLREDYDELPEGLKNNPVFKKVSNGINEMEAFYEVHLLKGIREKIYKTNQKGTNMKIIETNYGISQKLKLFFNRIGEILKISKPELPTKDLSEDIVEKIMNMVWDIHVKELTSILQDIPAFNIGNWNPYWMENQMALKLQKNVFQTMDYIYKQKIITAETFKSFFKTENTLEIASFNLILSSTIEEDLADRAFRFPNLISLLNQWHCENYRNLYKGNVKKIIHSYSPLSLKCC
jgi:hypothetical protein